MNKDIIKTEVCVESLEAALYASEQGTDRIELCGNLKQGGTTPSAGLCKEICNSLEIPIFCMLRPRGGNFVYSSWEMKTILAEIEPLKNMGAAGFVFGSLNSNFEIDIAQLEMVLSAIYPLPLTFHRAIDRTSNPVKAVNLLNKYSIERILSSGGKKTAESGISVLKQMVEMAGTDIEIMAGSGVNQHNYRKIIEETGVKEIHFSGEQWVANTSLKDNGLELFDASQLEPQKRKVREIIQQLQK